LLRTIIPFKYAQWVGSLLILPISSQPEIIRNFLPCLSLSFLEFDFHCFSFRWWIDFLVRLVDFRHVTFLTYFFHLLLLV
jgi:hypothetical protein